MTLTKISLSAAFWLGLLKVVIKLFSFIKLIVIARILTPADLGLFGIVLLPYGLVEVMTESGVNQALIQTRKKLSQYLGSAWLVFIIRGFFISLVLFLSAPLISRFYQLDLTKMIRIISLTPLLKGLVNPAIVVFRKELRYKREFVFQSLASVTESVATIVLVYWLKSVTALALGVMIGGLTTLFISFLFIQLPKFTASLKKIKELLNYGKWVTLGTFISYLNDQGDDFLVSKSLGAYSLGLYQTAFKISNLPTTQGAGLIYMIIFPIFSSIQTDKVRLKRGLIKALLVTFLLSLVFVITVYFFSPLLIKVFLGSAWLAIIPVLNVLLIYALTRPLISVSSAVFDAVGQPQIVAGINLLRFLVMLILLFPLTRLFDIVGTAWAVVLAQVSVYPWFLINLKKTLSDSTNLERS